MSNHRWALAIAAGLLLLAAGCRGGQQIIDPPETPLIQVIHAPSRSLYRIYAPPGSVDAGSWVVVDGAGTHNEVTAETDGGLLLEVDDSSAAAAVSQLPHFSISYVKDGAAGQLNIAANQIIKLESQVTTPLFSTGAGPNDMVLGLDSLYVANSFDNTVVRYGLDGEVLATATFAEYSSPSFLALHEQDLFVASNGENTLKQYDATDLGAPEVGVVDFTDLSYPDSADNRTNGCEFAFLGPGQITATGNEVLIPFAQIMTFDPPVYAEPFVLWIEYPLNKRRTFGSILAGPFEEQPGARNAQFTAYSDSQNRMAFVATGELRFDELWQPYVASPSYIGVRVPPGDFQMLDMGLIGAGRIAISGDGQQAVLGNALNGNLYRLHLGNAYDQPQVLRGDSNPIVLTEEYTYISDVAYTPDGRYILATSFNTDELYVIDAATDEVNPHLYAEPFDLSLDPELMAGCANVEIDPTPRADGGYDVYVLYGVANAVAKIELF